jgi:hypothetical protein
MPEMMGVRMQDGMTPRSSCVLIYTLDPVAVPHFPFVDCTVSHVRDALEIIYKAQLPESVPYLSSALTVTYESSLHLNLLSILNGTHKANRPQIHRW